MDIENRTSDIDIKQDDVFDANAKDNGILIIGGVCGIINLGNTCYMNAGLQCIMGTDVFATYFLKRHYMNDLKHGIIKKLKKNNLKINKNEFREIFKNTITYKFRTLVIFIWGTQCMLKPESFKKNFSQVNTRFSGYSQEDSHEFVMSLLDIIHEETKTDVIFELTLEPNLKQFKNIYDDFNAKLLMQNLSPDDKILIAKNFEKFKNSDLETYIMYESLVSWQYHIKNNHSCIIDIFTALILSEVCCCACSNKTIKFDPMTTLTLEIGNSQTNINKCFENFCNGENIDYNCKNCNNTKATKKLSLWHTPPRLIISLKRFQQMNARFFAKNNNLITFPLENFNLMEYIHPFNKTNEVYDLYGIVQHLGSYNGGHYIAFTKNMLNNNWYRYDDDKVIKINNDDIEKYIMTPNTYMLFYAKKGNVNLVTIDN